MYSSSIEDLMILAKDTKDRNICEELIIQGLRLHDTKAIMYGLANMSQFEEMWSCLNRYATLLNVSNDLVDEISEIIGPDLGFSRKLCLDSDYEHDTDYYKISYIECKMAESLYINHSIDDFIKNPNMERDFPKIRRLTTQCSTNELICIFRYWDNTKITSWDISLANDDYGSILTTDVNIQSPNKPIAFTIPEKVNEFSLTGHTDTRQRDIIGSLLLRNNKVRNTILIDFRSVKMLSYLRLSDDVNLVKTEKEDGVSFIDFLKNNPVGYLYYSYNIAREYYKLTFSNIHGLELDKTSVNLDLANFENLTTLVMRNQYIINNIPRGEIGNTIKRLNPLETLVIDNFYLGKGSAAPSLEPHLKRLNMLVISTDISTFDDLEFDNLETLHLTVTHSKSEGRSTSYKMPKLSQISITGGSNEISRILGKIDTPLTTISLIYDRNITCFSDTLELISSKYGKSLESLHITSCSQHVMEGTDWVGCVHNCLRLDISNCITIQIPLIVFSRANNMINIDKDTINSMIKQCRRVLSLNIIDRYQKITTFTRC